MNLIDNKKDLRIFIFILGGICVLIGSWPLLKGFDIRWPWLIPALLLIAVGVLRPTILLPLFRVWVKVARFIGRVNSFFLLAVVFYLILFPIGLIARLFRVNHDKFSFARKGESYWIKREPVNIRENMRMPF